jgi:hypothetical protein
MTRWVVAVLVLIVWRGFLWLLGHADGPPWQGIGRGELALLCLLFIWWVGGRLNATRRKFV